jgi:hypothetical protein
MFLYSLRDLHDLYVFGTLRYLVHIILVLEAYSYRRA